MKLLSIGSAGATDEIRTRLQQDCKSFCDDGFRIAVDEINKGGYTFLGCSLAEGELSFYNYEKIKSGLKNFVAKILADIIILREEKKIIRNLVDGNYYYFSESERDLLYENTVQILNSNTVLIPDFNFSSRYMEVQSILQEYLETNHELVLEGFVHFRLKQYRSKLSQLIDKVVDDFVLELEYKEFIRVLRYFVDVQEPRIDEVHVVISGPSSFHVLDKCGKPVNNPYVENIILQKAEEINYDDLLVSALISIAPHHIILHNSTKSPIKDLYGTIRSIFEDRVALCDSGCPFCTADILSTTVPGTDLKR